MPIAQSSKSAFDFANRPNYCLYDAAASATLALGTWNELSELRGLLGIVIRWVQKLQTAKAAVSDMPGEEIARAKSLADTLIYKYEEMGEPPYELIHRLEQTKRFLEYVTTIPRRTGVRIENDTGYNRVREYVAKPQDTTLQHIAARQMGGPDEVRRIVALNRITPYEWEQEDPAGKTVKLPDEESIPQRLTNNNVVIDYPEGELILGISIDNDPENGPEIDAETGDFGVVAGYENFRQELIHRFLTPAGELEYAATYGSRFAELVGTAQAAGLEEAMYASEYVRVALHDARTATVNGVEVQRDGDAVIVVGYPVTVLGQGDKAVALSPF